MDDLSRYNPEGSMLRKAQHRMLEVYGEIDKICRKHNIPYWINGGTLLGAVRHQGFIPWDDDFDIEILRKDYKKLIAILKKELPQHLAVQAREIDKRYPYYFAKVYDLNSEAIIEDAFMPKPRYTGLSIDIFPIEPAFPKLRKLLNKYFVKAHFSIVKGGIKAVIAYPAYLALKLVVNLYRTFAKLLKATHYMYVFGQSSKQIYTSDIIFPLSTIEFEKQPMPCPRDWDSYLKANFGSSYMTPPPPEKRQVHYNEIKSVR